MTVQNIIISTELMETHHQYFVGTGKKAILHPLPVSINTYKYTPELISNACLKASQKI